jgi:hypothetical protein
MELMQNEIGALLQDCADTRDEVRTDGMSGD